jgi:hypothetical protein
MIDREPATKNQSPIHSTTPPFHPHTTLQIRRLINLQIRRQLTVSILQIRRLPHKGMIPTHRLTGGKKFPTVPHHWFFGLESHMSPVQILHGASFDPETTSLMAAAFDEACRVAGHAQPPLVKEVMAKRIIEAAHRGERNAERLTEFALAGLNPIADTA